MASSSIAVRELPLFPLPEVVLFPGRPLPLHIFEFRYRMMMNTILEYDRRFGVLMIDPISGEIAKVGCCAEIIHFERLPDDRMKVLTLGQQRFRLLEYVRQKPYRVGLVEWFEDLPPQENLQPKAEEVTTLLHDVVKLSAKLTDQKIELPENLPTQPIELSYWVASNLYGVASEQQALLEIDNTGERLQREADILATTRSNLAARTALKDAFN
ncbi:LON peptidase substrate-binding domain-containing protein [Cyanobacterium aponinum UTEX 3222]|uniref:Peptidase S16 lon domain protein n=3 Tax=Cyanobacterium aponinum TaxID=379064 RepID=K9Z680_CYAAP|nr:LON peptidase substrate-binding domain-containing protein [Cyanobacterium aponinum]RMD71237.1 MAG: ATP-dependent protease [Cyanobacteria bacterium J149]WRL41168.1 LON peptidase substrate-binding domain-containing protein [Cyanobacterium aponinum UTEX 3222]AFZ53913.1 peptidase S16 lon domain protein [Cyanobacterium aponinum PCC 10605]MTF39477.1 ATP-dependent protease [Cyanobacterium aponinum 0216]WPF89410.1 LON peptidase substrate-binding domain-containing protein [Cyanobacterium aponinum AL